MSENKFRALSLAAASVFAILGVPAPANAQAQSVSFQATPVDFNIPAQPLASALTEFSRQSQIPVLVPNNIVRGRTSVTISGEMSPSEALARMSAGSGLQVQQTPEGGLTLIQDQTTSPTRLDAASNAASSDDEIIVTAQKREERLAEVPQSVSVLDGDELTRLGVTQFRDYADSVPGLSYNSNGAGYTQIVLRGVTTGYEASSPVAIYVDEVPYGGSGVWSNSARQAFDAGLFDIDRIEVLRGPQGTLYGASAVGGLVKYVSRLPDTEELTGQLHAGVATTVDGGLSHTIAGALNLPISEGTAGLRVSSFRNHDGGYIDNAALDRDDVNRSDIEGGRIDLLLTPADQLSIRLTAHAQNISRDGEGSADFNIASVPPGDEHLVQYRPINEPFEQEFVLYSATVNYDFGWAALTSISALQETTSAFTIDFSPFAVFYGPYNGLGQANLLDTKKFTQELRLTSSIGQTFEWVVGGFYTDEETDYYSAYVASDLSGEPVPDNLFTSEALVAFEESAIFGTLTWNVTDRFDVSGGVRYAQNDQNFAVANTGLFATPDQPRTSSSGDARTYLANARYRVNDRSILYARYATGYRPGGPNSQYFNIVTNSLVVPEPFDSDYMDSYELGFRSESADGRFAIDLAAYYIDWENIIIRVYEPATNASYYDNAAGMRVEGAELTLTARPADDLTLAGAFAYTDAYLTEAHPFLGATAGERMPTVPNFTANLMADYTFSGAPGTPTIGATFRYVDERSASFDGSAGFPQYALPEYTSVDLRAGWTFDPYQLQLYARNVFDERGQTSAYTWQGNARVAYAQPRTIGLTVTTRF
jgi:outer membrane receptor protein involved in Fe transport